VTDVLIVELKRGAHVRRQVFLRGQAAYSSGSLIFASSTAVLTRSMARGVIFRVADRSAL
jgi:hypothetical protein